MDINLMIQAVLRKRWQAPPQAPCPSEADLAEFLAGLVSETTRRRIQDHLIACSTCLDAVAQVNQAHRIQPRLDPPEGLMHQVHERLGLARKNNQRPSWFRRQRYLYLALLAFAGSFFMPRYFLQWLALGLILGGKWVFDATSTRALVMIYESIRKDRRLPPKRGPEGIEHHLKSLR